MPLLRLVEEILFKIIHFISIGWVYNIQHYAGY